MLRAVLCLYLLLTACGQGGEPPAASRAALVEDQYAYHIGVLAYLYGYPMVDRYRRTLNANAVDSAVATPEFDPMRSLGFFETLNLLLREQASPAGTEALLTQFDLIGVGPGAVFDQSSLSPGHKRGLERAIRDARLLIESAAVPAEADEFDYLARAARYRSSLRESSVSP